MVNSNTVGMVHGVAVLALVAVVLWRSMVGLGWLMKDKTDEEKKVTWGMWVTLSLLSLVVLGTGTWFGWSLLGEKGAVSAFLD